MNVFNTAPSVSLLGKHLTPAVWDALKDVTTRSGVTLQDCIRSGLVADDSVIGVYAGDEESFETFGLLFEPLIRELYPDFLGWSPQPTESAQTPWTFDNLDPTGAYIHSTRIRLARNLRGYRLMPAITTPELLAVEQRAQDAFAMLPADLAGHYCSVPALEMDAASATSVPNAVHIHAPGFDGRDRFQRAAGITRSWPEGRGVFLNREHSLQVWVNEEDHLRLISIEPGGDMAAAYARLQRAHTVLERSLPFQYSPRYGYLTACPSNLGTGLRAGFRMHLPLARQSEKFRAICDAHGMEVRSPAGEGAMVWGASSHALCDISNRGQPGVTAVQSMEGLLRGATELIALERSLAL